MIESAVHSRLQQIIKMERKKPDKPNYALPVGLAEYYQGVRRGPGALGSENLNESLFFKYASSIIQVVPEDKLEFSYSGGAGYEHRNAIFEISQVKEFQGCGVDKGNSFYQESNNYNNMAAKMKKKVANKKLLAYNFSNLTMFYQKISALARNALRNGFEAVKENAAALQNQDYHKAKKEIKRSSFYSGYTTSTSNEDKIGKKQSKKLTEQKKKEMFKEAAHQIKGYIEFKTLINISDAFNNIAQHANSCTAAFQKLLPLGISQAQTIKNEPLQRFYLTEYPHDNSISIAREIHHDISESLVYTADQNFEFTQKEVMLTTPQKFSNANEKQKLPPSFTTKKMQKVCSEQESIVESYRPKQSKNTPSPVPCKEKITLAISKPLKMLETSERRYLNMRTNIYQLPLLSEHDITRQKQKGMKDLSILADHFSRSQPQTCDSNQSILKELLSFNYIPKAKSRQFNTSEASNKDTKNGQRLVEFSKSSDKWTSAQRKEQLTERQELIKVASINYGPAIDQEKNQPKLQNYYYVNQKASPKVIQKNKAKLSKPETEKHNFQQIKSVESVINPTHQTQERKGQKIVKFHQSVVNQFTSRQDQKYFLAKPEEKKAPIFSEAANQQEQRIKSRSKINIMMQQSPRKQSPKVKIYHTSNVEVPKTENKPLIKNIEKHRYPAQHPYCSPPSNHEKPNSPRIIYEQKNIQNALIDGNRVNSRERVITIKQDNAYHMNQGTAYGKQEPATPQRMVNQIRSNEKNKIHQPMRVDNPMKNSPGKALSPNYLITSQDKRQNPLQVDPSQMKRDDKVNHFYSPQIGKDIYMQSPPKMVQQHSQAEKMQVPMSNVRRMYSQQEYFNKQGNMQAQLRTVNFNNNYYTGGPQAVRQPPIINEVNRNVFQQEEPQRKQVRYQRPPSSRQRVNLFSNYQSPLQSELEYQQRSNNFSKNSSELSRPKSMNEKIFITLRKDK